MFLNIAASISSLALLMLVMFAIVGEGAIFTHSSPISLMTPLEKFGSCFTQGIIGFSYAILSTMIIGIWIIGVIQIFNEEIMKVIVYINKKYFNGDDL